ncbi:sugar diacid utilization regulator [Anaerosolibacter carboniphilus]|uniref:Sugar diacid utilization regulator n=1 Tax=Anaerosolibacter carboniphilus TaxID=1417629 RepID=A0A841L0F9_9FIRM|nr:helix-turn-helix domain-containing protein [Anaerosolibacter carboniphilus]MBB6215875.1 sugar diacid utilization regulator [Anaerosolibacter carboniphilus]
MITLENISQKLPFDIYIIKRGIDLVKYSSFQLITPFTQFDQSNTLYIGQLGTLSSIECTAIEIGLLLQDGNMPEIDSQSIEIALFSCTIQECFQAVQNIFYEQAIVGQCVFELYESLSCNEGLQRLAEIGKKYLGNPVAISDASYVLLANSGQEENDLVWGDTIANGRTSSNLISKFHLEGLVETLMNTEGPVFLDMGIAKKRHRILSKVIIDGKLTAICGVIESIRTIKKSDLDLMQVLSDAVAIELQKMKYSVKDDKNISSLLIDILESKVYMEKTLEERLKYLHWRPKKYFNVVILKKNESINMMKDFIKRSLESFSFFSKAFEWEDNMVILINYNNEEFSKISSEITILLKEQIKESAGISKTFSRLLQLPGYYNQAVSAHYWGSALNRNDCLYCYQDYYIYHLLGSSRKEIDIEGMRDERLMKLIEYDKKNKTEYFNTLYVFLSSKSSVSKAADKLFIHRNTMAQRIKRICEIVDIDLSSNQDIVNIMLTYKILELIG